MEPIKISKKYALFFFLVLFTIIWVAYVSSPTLNFLDTSTGYIQVLVPNNQKLVLHHDDYSQTSFSNNNFAVSFLETSQSLTTSFYIDNDVEEISPLSISNDNQSSFWTIDLFGQGMLGKGNSGEDVSNVKKNLSSFRINITTNGENGFWRLIHDYGSELEADWSTVDHFAFWWYGGSSGLPVEIRVESSSDSGFASWYFTDDYDGWKRQIFNLNAPHFSTINNLHLALSNVRFISIGYLPISGVWYLDEVLLDVGLPVTIQFDLSQLPETVKQLKLYSFNPKNSYFGNYEGPALEYNLDLKEYSNFSAPLFFLDGSDSMQVFGAFSNKLIVSSSKLILNLKIPPHDGLVTEIGGDSSLSGCSQMLIKMEFVKEE